MIFFPFFGIWGRGGKGREGKGGKGKVLITAAAARARYGTVVMTRRNISGFDIKLVMVRQDRRMARMGWSWHTHTQTDE